VHLSPEVISGVVAAVAAAMTFGLTFLVRSIAQRRGLVVQPDAERVHTTPTATAGGVALVLGAAIALLVAAPLGGFHSDFVPAAGVIAAAAVMAILGLIDDVRNVSPPAKVAGQVLAAMVLYFFGITMTHVKVPFFPGYLVLTSTVLPLVTALWVIGIANAVNLIDGLDGLAAGVVAIGSGTLCVYGLRLMSAGVLNTNNIGPFIAAACSGACIGFLPHNFHRAKIFMGDTGAMVLGLLMAAGTMEIGGQADYVVSGTTYFFFAPLVVPFAILGVPIFDTALSIVRRTIRRSGVMERDLGHIHYQLMRLGHGHRRTVIVLWIWTLVLSALVLYPTFDPSWNGVVPFAIGALAVVLVTLFRPGRARRANGARSSDAEAGKAVGEAVGDATLAVAAPLASGSDGPNGAPPAPLPGKSGDRRGGYHRASSRRFARHRPPMRG
jgi:UDP-GlcNAc:undecaprenyl-phosphate GlcNAc-1-phosphate transferase